ncbi:oxidoreductase [Desulfobacula phenolica]|uniref:2,4-dienoyl-CoA reductase (NADPH2) n=1 Tax=Desulfobacula phenolica TaxID=90732 RepID=A0A1H2GH24_9BACT|nr:FAD-dependent oxidoreductase [Desulfobacula phenolica]SDU18708.1 2,4-dienoyl-CoA reductase (NADPH2) [Desulfobacula phenolica]
MRDPIFEPITINTLNIKNRIYLPAMHLGMAQDFKITDQIIDFYALRAKGGAGMICTGYATVDELSGNTQTIGAHNDKFIPGLKRLSKAIKENGSLAAIQINHAGRYNFSSFLKGKQPVAPSPIASRLTKEIPKEMTVNEIKKTVKAFAKSASRVKTAGFDAVEVLSGTGYLISEFLSPLTNHRTDRYGGSFKNRMRFGIEVVQAVRDSVGKDFPLIVRMNGNDFMPGGNSRHEIMEYAKALSFSLADALCINVGWHEARVPQIVASVPRGAFAYLARGIKQDVTIPVIASHRINDPKTARQMLDDGLCDMVAMGRSLIADPMLPEKTRHGRENEIIHCIACAQGCFDNLFKLKHVECLCNPLAGHEGATPVKKISYPKKVLVAGGGVAGMTAALAAHSRGHDVVIYESGTRLGGQLYLAAAPPGREEFAQLAKDLETQISVKNIPVALKTKVDEQLIKKQNPDTVILATGAKPVVPSIPGINLPHVVKSWDVLQDNVCTGRKIAIIGGGAVGVETALFLAEKGTLSAEIVKFLLVNRAEDPETLFEMATCGTKQITLIEMLDKVGKNIGKSTKWVMMQDLERHHVKTMTDSKVIEITPRGLKIEKAGNRHEIDADTVVVAAGSAPNNPLESILKCLNKDYKVVGDARQIALAFDAVHQGYKAGLDV